MHAVIARLQTAARRVQLSGGLEQSKYSRIVAQLREVTEELNAAERRVGNEKPDPVNFADLLHGAAAGRNGGIMVQVPEDIMVAGPAHDLRDLICSLTEHALAVAREPVKLRAQVKYPGDSGRAVCATELVIQSANVPDFLRQKLWEAVRIRRGEVSVVSEAECSRIELALPIERRCGTILG